MGNPDLEANRRGNGRFGNAPANSDASADVSETLAAEAEHQRQLDALDARREAALPGDFGMLARIGRQGTTLVVQHEFPTATTVILGDEDEDDNTPYLVVNTVLDDEENVLWDIDANFDGKTDSVLAEQEHLSRYSFLLDREPRNLEQLTDGPSYLRTWRYRLD